MTTATATVWPRETTTATLRELLDAKGIPRISPDEVARIKRSEQHIRWDPWFGYLAMLVTNGYLTLAGMGSTLVLSYVLPFNYSFIAGISLAAAIGIAWLICHFGDLYGVRDAGAHWRTAKLVPGTYTRYAFWSANRKMVSAVPSQANVMIAQAQSIPGARVEVEFLSDDPFLKVTRGLIFREKEYILHWV